ncbi:oncostatin-M [Lepus europaeus]|uniref:oncostatin-M n=1 Tax=Lepus europaeus TaxID=9983 RepID=UPI002B4725DB|nr:oncostatin-M [Lepus europaeus]
MRVPRGWPLSPPQQPVFPMGLNGVVLGLLLLSTTARCSCSRRYPELLGQLRNQVDLLQNPESLLIPYVQYQGLEVPGLSEPCTERPGDFPSEAALQRLGRPGFLWTLNATIGHVLPRLEAMKQQLFVPTDLEELKATANNLLGLRSNLYCMTRLLQGSSEPAKPTQAGPGPSPPPPTRPQHIFQAKLEDRRFLCGYHRFMRSARQVFSEWPHSLNPSPRHSPRGGLRKQIRRIGPSTRTKRRKPRRKLPR